ncbi:hypothetical protein FG386_002269 [Cryptosporidium ryanae]|uniref:uncharacterized protein n=1 Tax=Cryptosporidium ryanae TaxID=515981 RepID=UPI00351A2F2F|nr:hypothetical protein FG386_002269 [Cryptosporidium ryanae]
MSSFILERCRSLCEETEFLERALAILFGKLPRDHVTSLIIQATIRRLGEEIQRNSNDILNLFLDSTGERKREISYLGGEDENGSDSWRKIWSNYYASIKTALIGVAQESALFNSLISKASADERKYGRLAFMESRVAEMLEEGAGLLEGVFLPEEDLGRRLCLEEHYNRFINLKKLRSYRESSFIDVELERLRRKGRGLGDIESNAIVFEEMGLDTYLKTYDDFSAIPRYFKYRDSDYEEYTTNLLKYLSDFFIRSHPLLNRKSIEDELEKTFEINWSKGLLKDWITPTCEMKFYSKPFDRLFFSQGTYFSHMKSKAYKKMENCFNSLSEAELEDRRSASIGEDKRISRVEFLISKYSQYLFRERMGTVEFVNRLQSSTKEELELDETFRDDFKGLKELVFELKNDKLKEDERNGSESKEYYCESGNNNDEDDEDDIEELQDKVYNPLKLPLGPDGRPMPYWLYKLNGLGIEFKCEICGNCSYWGRRAFERHFQEARHSNALNALGIPNTSHFKEITRISDALELYSSLCKQAKDRIFDEQSGLEMEDSEGNVVTLKTFNELHSRGVI